jgi:hypothetical protein
LSEKKTTLSFYCPEKIKDFFLQYIGWSENSEKGMSDCFIEYVEKLILNRNSLAAQLPASEKETDIEDLPQTKEDLIQKLKEKQDPYARIEIPCIYGVWHEEKQMVECQRFLKTKQKIVYISLDGCKKCYKRRQWIEKNKPKNIQQIFCNHDGLWVYPTKCVNCKNPCEKAPATNPYLSDIERYKRKEGEA